MKRFICVCLCLLLCLGLVSCGDKKSADVKEDAKVGVPATAKQKAETQPNEKETKDKIEKSETDTGVQMPYVGEKTFLFSSGAGGWWTELIVKEDGTFVGHYQDSDMGSGGDGYKGTYYFCDFKGYFEKIEEVDDYSYRLTLGELTLTNEKNEPWIDGETLKVPSTPYGMEDCKTFFLYVPGTDVRQFPEDFLSWWPTKYTDAGGMKTMLDSYAIHNIETGDAFFSVAQ